ncbi:MAG: (d)CMP kinase [Kiritimatiellia bacterium]
MNNPYVIAIDGPSASGKSTVTRRVAEELKIIYVDSGSLYRGLTWKALRDGIDVKDPEKVLALLALVDWKTFAFSRAMRYTLDGEEPGAAIRAQEVHDSVSYVARIPEVRFAVTQKLREFFAEHGSLAVEGRDIGSVVFPDSPYKFYLDADPAERARRRHQEMETVGGDVDDTLASLRKRDHLDTTRMTAPLQIALGAEVLDSTHLSIDDVVKRILERVRAARRRPSP